MESKFDSNWCLHLMKEMKHKALYNVKSKYGVSLADFTRLVYRALNNGYDFSHIFKEEK